MRKTSCPFWVAVLVAGAFMFTLLAPAAQAQEPEKPADVINRYSRVKEWTGTFSVKFKYATQTNPYPNSGRANGSESFEGSTEWSVTGSLRLKQDADFKGHWQGDGRAGMDVNYQCSYPGRNTKKELVPREHSWAGSGRTTCIRKEVEFIRPTLSLSVPQGSKVVFYELTNGQPNIKLRGFSVLSRFHKIMDETRTASLKMETGRVPIPQTGMRLQGNTQMAVMESITGGHPAVYLSSYPFGGPHLWDITKNLPMATVTWDLAAVAEDVELVVEPDATPKYEDWVPHADKNERTPGNHVGFVAKLQGKGGKAPTRKAKKIVFDLVDVSREPGIAINYPPRKTAVDDFDLQFDKKLNGAEIVVMGKQGQRAESAPKAAGVTEAAIKVSAYDWGAHGILRVSAEMDDGSRAVGHFKKDPKHDEILLPYRTNGSRIADAMRKKLLAKMQNDPDDSDNENVPVGDGFKGDGLTLYEEYRGFYVNGEHTRGDPVKKDLFVWDKVRNDHADPGIRHFERLTGIIIHRVKNDDEVMINYVVNYNFSPRTPRKTSQHAVKFGEGGVKATWSMSVVVETIPGSPKGVRLILLAPGSVPGSEAFKLMTAHELGHALNIPHHGQMDLGWTVWKTAKDKDGKPILTETPFSTDEAAKSKAKPQTIVVKNEDGTPFTDKSFDEGVKIWVAKRQGQHSGDVSCLMRYYAANAYVAAGNDSLRYWNKPPEVRGSSLCKAKTATGAAAHRYGDALMGDCLHRFRISDAP